MEGEKRLLEVITSSRVLLHSHTHIHTHTHSHAHIHTRHLAFQEEPQNYKIVVTIAELSLPPFKDSAPPGNDLYGCICLFLFCLPIGFGSGGKFGVEEEWGISLRTLAELKWTQFSPDHRVPPGDSSCIDLFLPLFPLDSEL